MLGSNEALVALGRALVEQGYEFISVTPSTHERVVVKEHRPAMHIRDVFGWNRVFAPHVLPANILELAHRANILSGTGQQLKSTVRFSTLGGRLFIHSGFPTVSADSVFFGPDSYRFCSLIERALRPCTRLVDVGCGSGVGGLLASTKATHVTLADINDKALQFAAVNAQLASVAASVVHSDVLNDIQGPIDAIIANPPYMCDRAGRTYRDGGGELGEGLALRIVRESLKRLQPGGQLVLYTGSAVVDGEDVFKRQVLPLCREAGTTFDYCELDPDVFGDELSEPAYARVERIAVVGLVVFVQN